MNKPTSNTDHHFILLNKDEMLATFHVDERFDTIAIDEVFWNAPNWIDDLRLFITNRRAPKHRENIQELLRLSGCDTILGYLQVSHSLSLIDTFWVKPAGSNLTWSDVSLYNHDFNDVIARTAFEGGLHGKGLSTTSPEYGTNGSFAKCWVREEGNIKLLKRGSSGARNAGLEPYSEFYAAQIVSLFTSEYVPYSLRSVNGRICSVCPLFTSEEYGFLPYAAVDKGNSDIPSVIETMARYGFEEKAKRMFVIDAVILNVDRHKNNFGFIVNNKTQEIVDMAPLFDHNLSLLPYAEEDDFRAIDKYIDLKSPALSDSWIKSAAMCLTDDTRKSLIKLQDFEFERGKYNLPEWRLEQLTRLVKKQAHDILNF